MTYYYTKPTPNTLRLSEITFCAKKISNPSPLNKVVFNYKTVTRVENRFINGEFMEIKLFLNSVYVFTNNLLFKSYEIKHNTQNYFYLHRDYQGSILAVSDDVGAIVEKRIFNPWGGIVQVQDGAGDILDKLTFFDRGYTGHHHMESVGLIHMNGRIYDPKLHRFLQPDNFVQDPYNTQSFNRYGYYWNNPLKYTDQSGELIDAVPIGAGIALAAYLTTSIISGSPITLRGAIIATFIGAIGGAVTCGIGTWTQCIKTFATKAATQAVARGIFQGIVSGVQGGGFWAGAAAGAISSVASSLYQGVGYDNAGWHGLGGCGATNSAGMIIFGTVMGGAGSALTGGNFWQGAVIGLVVSGLNHAMHMRSEEIIDQTEQQDPEQKSNIVGPQVPVRLKYNMLYNERKNNLKYKQYLKAKLDNVNQKIKQLNLKIKSSWNSMKVYEDMETFSRKYEQQDPLGTGRGAASALNGAKYETDSVNMSLQRTKLIELRNTLIKIP